jgi:hypothetical protein
MRDELAEGQRSLLALAAEHSSAASGEAATEPLADPTVELAALLHDRRCAWFALTFCRLSNVCLDPADPQSEFRRVQHRSVSARRLTLVLRFVQLRGGIHKGTRPRQRQDGHMGVRAVGSRHTVTGALHLDISFCQSQYGPGMFAVICSEVGLGASRRPATQGLSRQLILVLHSCHRSQLP